MPDEDDFFADVDSFNHATAIMDPVTEYFESSPLAHVSDPITYWHSQLAGGHPLAQMGLDFLSAPAASIDVERAFSRGGLTVSKRRHALSDESVRAATVLGSWAALKGIVPEDKMLEIFHNKSKRTKKGGASNVYIDVDEDV